jgi:3-dehydroquinate dehydratase-2
MRFLIVNGPNLNMLGTREPAIYGDETLPDVEARLRHHARRLAASVATFQSNHEGAIIDVIQDEGPRCDGIVINAGALSHYSYAIHDALVAVARPTVEVHISNIHERDAWRRTSVTAPAADLLIVGRGTLGYVNAIDHLWALLVSPPVTEAYGPDPDQVLDVRVPSPSRGIVVLLHGGFWRHVWARDLMDPLAVHLTSRGWATVNVEYRRGPGAFPDTLEDVTSAIRWVREHLGGDGDPRPIIAVGHSAGGYLAVRAVDDPSVTSAVALAPVLDVDAISSLRAGDDDPIAAWLGGTEQDLADVWTRARLATPPSDVHVIHGSLDEAIPVDHSRRWVDAVGGSATFTELAGTDHMSVIDPFDGSVAALHAALDRTPPDGAPADGGGA